MGENEILVTFWNEGKRIGTRSFVVPTDNVVPLPIDSLFAFRNAELRIKANWEKLDYEQKKQEKLNGNTAN